MSTMTIDTVLIAAKAACAAIEAAIREFDGADWTHEADQDADGEPIYCTGDVAGCDICADAQRDSDRCGELGRAARKALAEGDYDEALSLVEQAEELEQGWGDSPAWDSVPDAVRALRDAVADAPADIYRAAYWQSADGQREVVLTGPMHADLPDAQLIEQAREEAERTGADLTSGELIVGIWTP